ncbi:MAG: sulfatase-like hydrolase/transferase, partial [Mariniphaga sp.]
MRFLKKWIPILIICPVLLTGCSSPGEQDENLRPNIVFLLAEDISPAFGCYGDEYATTPNVDKLASGGMVYDLALTTAPICAPTRSALVSGLYA